MIRTLALIVLFAVSSGAVLASSVTAGDFITTGDKEGPTPQVTPALQFSLNTKAPFECSPKEVGSVALTAQAGMCICDGKAWTVANRPEDCQWSLQAK